VWRLATWIIALALIVGVACVAVDAAQRVATFNVFIEGHGVPVISPPAAFEAAEQNVRYVLGLIVGVATGVASSLAVAICLRLSRPLFSPNKSLHPTAATSSVMERQSGGG
jgi:hypothetical protein